MSVIILGAEDTKFAVRETVPEIRDILDNLTDEERHVGLTDLGGDPILVHRDMLDLVTT